MKRSQVINNISDIICDYKYYSERNSSDLYANRILDYLEEMGMLSPLSTVKAIPNELRPGTIKHTQVKHERDERMTAEEARKLTKTDLDLVLEDIRSAAFAGSSWCVMDESKWYLVDELKKLGHQIEKREGRITPYSVSFDEYVIR